MVIKKMASSHQRLDVNVVEQQLALLADRAVDRKLRFGMPGA
jgi:hypothetical protein